MGHPSAKNKGIFAAGDFTGRLFSYIEIIREPIKLLIGGYKNSCIFVNKLLNGSIYRRNLFLPCGKLPLKLLIGFSGSNLLEFIRDIDPFKMEQRKNGVNFIGHAPGNKIHSPDISFIFLALIENGLHGVIDICLELPVKFLRDLSKPEAYMSEGKNF